MEDRYRQFENDNRLSYNVTLEVTGKECNVYADFKHAGVHGFVYNISNGLYSIAMIIKAKRNISYIRMLVKWLEFPDVSYHTVSSRVRFAKNYLSFLYPFCKTSNTIYKAGIGNTEHLQVKVSCLVNPVETLESFNRNIAGLIE